MGKKLDLLYFRFSEKAKLFLVNFFWHSFSKIINKASRLLLVLIAAKIIGSHDWGVYSYVLSLATLGFILSDWGMSLLLIRDYPESDDKNKTFSNFFLGRLIVLSISLAASLSLIFLSGNFDYILIGLLLSLTLFLDGFGSLYHGLFIADQDTKKEFYSNLVDTFVLIVSFIIFFRIEAGVISLSVSYLAASLFGFLASVVLSKNMVRFSFSSVNIKNLKAIFVNGFSLSLFGISSYIFFSTDQLVLKYFSGFSEVGIYSLVSRLILALIIIPPLINAVLLPQMSIDKRNYFKMKRYLLAASTALLLSALACVAFIIIFSPLIVSVFFGTEYLLAIPILRILSLIIVPLFIVSILDYFLIVYNMQLYDFLLTLFASLVNLVLNIILVPKLGMNGAAIASIIGQYLNMFLTLSLVIFVLKRKCNAEAII